MVGVVSVAVTGLLIDRTVRKMVFEQVAERLRYEVTMTGQMAASALFAPLAADDTSLQGPITELSNAVHTQLGVLTPDGVVAADSERAVNGKPSLDSAEPEIVTTLREGKGSAVRGEGAGRRLWIAERVVRDGAVLGIARASVPMSIVDAQVNLVRRRVLWAALAALLLASPIGIGLSLGISRPIRRLAEVARRIGEGDLEVRSAEPPGDEVGELSKALSDMSVKLKAMVAKLDLRNADMRRKLDLRNADMRRVLDAIDEGLLVVAPTGAIETERPRASTPGSPSPKLETPLWDLFQGASSSARASFEMGWSQLADGVLPIELLIDQLPKRIVDGDRT